MANFRRLILTCFTYIDPMRADSFLGKADNRMEVLATSAYRLHWSRKDSSPCHLLNQMSTDMNFFQHIENKNDKVCASQ